MNKIFGFVIVFVCLTSSIKAQVPDTLICDYADRDTTEAELLPWFGNNDYLENFLDSIGYPSTASRIVGTDKVRYRVPIKFWVYRNSSGIGGPTMVQLQNYIDNLNRFYNIDNNTWIGFYLKCDIGYINDDDHLVINNDLEAVTQIQSHKEQGCINIHITNELNGVNGVHYRARFFGIDGIFLNRNTYTDPNLASTVAHEVGHYFELDHTHQYSNRGKCRKEAIDRNRTWPFISFCPFGGGGPSSQKISEATGDFLRDTPADHDLNSNYSCNYNITGQTDPWGDHYETPPVGSLSPDTKNILSYNGLRGCRDIFSRLQIAVMLHSIVRGKSKNNKAGWGNLNGIYDEYEFDNFSETARPITIGEIQERNFHQQILSENMGTPTWSQCDVDWIRFQASCSATLELFTDELTGYSQANTRLTLYNGSLVQLAQNDDISSTNLFSSITYNFISGQTYFIRVENISPGTLTRFYRLRLGRFDVTGSTAICTPQTYTVTNLPASATITWSASPSGIVSFSPVGPTTSISTTVTRVGNGTAEITATVSVCGSTFGITKSNVSVGAPPKPGTINWTWNAPPSRVHLDVGDVPGATSYKWYLNAVLKATTTTSYYNLPMSGNVECGNSYYFGVKAVNSCGTSEESWINAEMPPCEFAFLVSPNPATNNLNIQPDPSKKNIETPTPDISTIKIYDQSGTLQKMAQFGSNQKTASINVGSLKPGIYFIEIVTPEFVEKHSLIKK